MGPSASGRGAATLDALLEGESLETAVEAALEAILELAQVDHAALMFWDGQAFDLECWRPTSPEPGLAESWRAAARAAIIGAPERPGAVTSPPGRIDLFSASGRVRGALCLGPVAAGGTPAPERAPRAIARLLIALAWRSAADREAQRVQAMRTRYERWFAKLDEQLRVLDRERQKFAAIVHRSDLRVFVTDLHRRVQWTNALLGSQRPPGAAATWVGQSCSAVCSGLGGGSACEECPVERALRDNAVAHREIVGQGDDEARTFYLSALPIKGPDGRPTESLAMIQDLSGLEVLRKSETRYRLLFERSSKAIIMVDPRSGQIVLANPMAGHLVGRASTELLGSGLDSLHGAEEWERLRPTYARALVDGSMEMQECRISGADGRERRAFMSAAGVDLEGSEVVMLEYQDITERRRVEQALREAEERLRTVVANAPVLVFALDADGDFTISEGRGLESLGLASGQVVGQSVFDVYREHPRVLENIRRVLAGEVFADTVDIGRLAFETWYTPMRDAEGRVSGAIGVATDVTERRRLEDQLRQAQKMEAIGRLAGGVAHDFNNLLAAIMGHGELLLRRLEPEHPLHRNAEEIQKAGVRGAMLTRQLLAFSRKDVLAPRPLDLNAVVAEMEEMLRRLIGEHISLETVLGDNPLHVVADRGQIEQVVMNLAVNARDAMPDGGRLTIEVSTVELDAAYAQSNARVTPGVYALIAVRDTGVGMDAETLSHVFEPFYTTKAHGKGTGLGLATVYGIVDQSRGHLSVASEPGIGTTFKVYLPLAVEVAPVPAGEQESNPFAGGAETLLLVEDEDAVRAMARELLELSGYTVLEARHGIEALERADAHEGPLDALVTDVVMPHMGGGELARELALRRPGIKVLYISGYTDDAVIRNGVLEQGAAFLQKPFSLESFARKVREVLDAPGADERAAA